LRKALLQFIQHRFQTRFRFRNEFETVLTLKILLRLITEHPESLLLTKSEVEAMVGKPLDAPDLQREYFPKRSITLLETALDELTTLSVVRQQSTGRTRYPLFQSIQIDQTCERIVFNLNVAVLPQLTQWSTELVAG